MMQSSPVSIVQFGNGDILASVQIDAVGPDAFAQAGVDVETIKLHLLAGVQI